MSYPSKNCEASNEKWNDILLTDKTNFDTYSDKSGEIEISRNNYGIFYGSLLDFYGMWW